MKKKIKKNQNPLAVQWEDFNSADDFLCITARRPAKVHQKSELHEVWDWLILLLL